VNICWGVSPSNLAFFDDRRRHFASGTDLFSRLIAELEVLLDTDRVFDAEEDDRRSDHEGAGNETPLSVGQAMSANPIQ
jgi:hypothetical protein